MAEPKNFRCQGTGFPVLQSASCCAHACRSEKKAARFVCCADGQVDANTDFYCKLTCTSGTGASPNATFIAPPGIYDPPYKINNNNTQLDLAIKVRLQSILVKADYKLMQKWRKLAQRGGDVA